MRKKTIGEVLRLARINQGLSLEELQRKTDIQLDMLEALESDDFDKLPSPFYARSFLRKYAWAVELDEEVDVDEIELSGRRRSNRKKRSLLPLFYFVLFSLSILIFVTYYVWNYIQTQPTETTSANYNIVTTTTNAPSSETTSSNQTTNPSSSTEASTVTVTGQGDVISVEYKTPKETAELQLSVADATSWVSVSDTDLAGGATLDPNNKTVKTTISKGSPVTITLGVVKGVKIKIDNQEIDTSKLTGQTGWITMNLSSN